MKEESIVNLIGIAINSGLAWWIVSNIQKNQSNERSIKDHFIDEVKELRIDCKNFMTSIYSGKKPHKDIVPSLKLIGIKASQLINVLNYCFRIDKDYFSQYLVDINTIITDDPNYISCANPDDKVRLSPETLKKLMRFHSLYQNRFNNLIIYVNESAYTRLTR